MRRWSLLVILVALVYPSGADAQRTAAQAGSGPEAVVRRFFEAVAKARWVEAAGFLELEPLDDQRREMIRSLRRPRRIRATTIEDILRANPEMPREVAEYQLKQIERHESRGLTDHFSFSFANVFDSTTLQQVGLLELGARWLEARDSRYQFRRARELVPSCQELQISDSAFAMLPVTRTVIGAVERGDTAYVLHKSTLEMPDERPLLPLFGPDVMILRRKQGWRIVPAEMLLGSGSVGLTCSPVADTLARDTSAVGRKPPP